MTSLVPFTGLSRWSDFDDYLDKELGFNFGKRISFTPKMDIIDHKDKIEFTVEVPGLEKEDIAVNVEDSILTISGEKKKDDKTENDGYYKRERVYGKFERSMKLPANIDTSRVEATMKSGILNITLSKKKELVSKKINIKVL